MPLSRLIYVSETQLDPAQGKPVSQLASIMKASIRNNQAADVTGALAFDGSWFIQVLEGERRTIWKTFQRIAEDERHGNCQLLQMSDVAERMFGNWWMGLATYDAVTAPAFRPYLKNGVLQADEMKASDVLDLMSALAKLGLHRAMRSAA